MSFSKKEIKAAKDRRSEVLSEILDTLTKPRQDGLSEQILRATLIDQAVGLSGLVAEAAARGAAVCQDMRDESLLALACLALHKLME
jgi:hypothetical protein